MTLIGLFISGVSMVVIFAAAMYFILHAEFGGDDA